MAKRQRRTGKRERDEGGGERGGEEGEREGEGKGLESEEGEGRKKGRGRKKGGKAGGGERGRGERWSSLLKGTAVQDFLVRVFCIKHFLWVALKPKEDSFEQVRISKILTTVLILRILKIQWEDKQTTMLYNPKKLGKFNFSIPHHCRQRLNIF